MNNRLSVDITRAASKQTYFTIRFLVDGARRADAYRAYAYFRIVDDILDGTARFRGARLETDSPERAAFIDRQKLLLDRCLRGAPPPNVSRHESMLVELVRDADLEDGCLESYLRQMMRVMDFDAGRRGRVIAGTELDAYTRSLSIAVTDAMQYFLGGDTHVPAGETRYAAVSGAHILHMLRDTYVDLQAGYFNIPSEVLGAHAIGPADVHSNAYRTWVAERLEQARAYLAAGRSYFAHVPNARHRLAGLAYIARFEWLIGTIERDGFLLRPAYDERHPITTGLRTAWSVAPQLVSLPRVDRAPFPHLARDGRA
jgi:phytoene/squalene synthetase